MESECDNSMLEEIKVEDEYDATISKQDHFGDGITKVKDKLIFVKDALPQDKCKIVITDVKKTFCLAKIKKIIMPSPNRIEAICPYYGECGGCDLMHQNYEEQLVFKENKVRELLTRFAGVKNIQFTSFHHGEQFHYRNKVVFHGIESDLGFYKEKSRELVRIKQCLLLDPKINLVYDQISHYLAHHEQEKIEELMIRKTSLDEVMVVVKGNIDKLEFLSYLQDLSLESIILNGQVLMGNPYITEQIFEMKFRILPEAFFQVNYKMMLDLYKIAVDYYQNKNYRRVLDLYCGTGTIGMLVSPYVEEVIGVEVVADAVKAARMNQELNHITNISFVQGKVEDYIDDFEQIDSILVDPPRSGLDTKTIKTILTLSPESIIYISCDPVTLSRDLKSLLNDYEIVDLQLVDMFPNTYHVETVVILEKKKKKVFDHYDVLVNRSHPYQEEDYQGMELIKTEDIEGHDVYVEKETYEHYLLFRTKLQELGIEASISSGYRTLAEQQEIIDEFCSRYPEEKVAKKVAPVGVSEHHTGLAIDITVRTREEYLSDQLDSEKQKMYGEQYQIMETICSDYGFILRYPKDKEEITGVSYEPWHFRYVGYPLSKEL